MPDLAPDPGLDSLEDTLELELTLLAPGDFFAASRLDDRVRGGESLTFVGITSRGRGKGERSRTSRGRGKGERFRKSRGRSKGERLRALIRRPCGAEGRCKGVEENTRCFSV